MNLEWLKNKWKVNTLQLVLIICTFALGGSTCGYVSRKILASFASLQGVLFVICYIILMCLLWPLCVLLISIPLGQFSFFKNYISNIKKRIFGGK
jgi:hypothetical protein